MAGASAAACWVRSLARGGPRYLLLHVNSVCNARCRMCFTWDRMMARWDARGLPLESLSKLAASLDPLPQLTVSGGEPLLRDDLADILAAFYERAGTRYFTVPTNALSPQRVARLADSFVERCPDGFLNFCLPFHGDEAASESILGVKGFAKKFDATYACIEERRARHPQLSCILNFVMSRYNCDSWREIVDRARDRYPETPLGIALCRGETHEAGAGEVPIELYEAAQRYLESRARGWSGFNPYTLMFDSICERIGTIVAEVARGERRDLACGAGRQLLVVYDDGSVYPCEMIDVVGLPRAEPGEAGAPAATALGNLHDFDFDARRLLASARSRELVDWIARHACACTWESAIYGKIVHSPGELVRLGGRVAGKLAAAAWTGAVAAGAPAAKILRDS
jgi:MoaA/NifB/PqqE/SkfB family radical SAM enzyme